LLPHLSDENVVYAVIGAGYNNGFKYFKGIIFFAHLIKDRHG